MLWHVPMLPEKYVTTDQVANKNRENQDAPNFDNVRLNQMAQ